MEATAELSYALNTFYFLVCGALVMWMAAGFAMLEAGLVRSKNTTEILTKNVVLFAIACTMYMVVGYDIMYGGGVFLDGLAADGVAGADEPAGYAPSADFFFQVVFVATAMSIVSGAVAERMKLFAFLIFAVVMTGFIYPMEGAWTWNGESVFGMYTLGDLGFSDFAGSGIVHMAGAAAGVAGVLTIGARKGKYTADGKVNAIPGANMPLATLGTFILWMGWFGFNVGSELAADGTAGLVLLTTQLCTAASVLGWLFIEWISRGKPTMLGGASGAVAGLVAITPACAFVGPMGAIALGLITGIVCFFACTKIKSTFGYDDSLDVFGVHGVGGIIGAIGAGILCAPELGGVGYAEGFTMGSQVAIQIEGVVITILWSGIASLILIKIVDAIVGIRPTEDEEREGLDATSHGEAAYHN